MFQAKGLRREVTMSDRECGAPDRGTMGMMMTTKMKMMILRLGTDRAQRGRRRLVPRE
jgi:hypothetical protein